MSITVTISRSVFSPDDIKNDVLTVKNLYQEQVADRSQAMKFSRVMLREYNLSYSYYVIPEVGVFRQLHHYEFRRKDGVTVPEDATENFKKPGYIGRGGQKKAYRIIGVEGQREEWTRSVFNKMELRYFVLCLPELHDNRYFNTTYYIEQNNKKDPRPAVLSRYITGGNLGDYFEKFGYLGGLSLPKCCMIALQMARSLQPLHEKSISHGDVKLANYLIEGVGEAGPRLVLSDPDFMCRADPSIRMTWGTEEYADPEIIRNGVSGEMMLAADIFSLGVCFFVLATNGVIPLYSAENIRLGVPITRKVFERRGFYSLDKIDNDYERLVYEMCDPIAANRPKIDHIVQRLEQLNNS